MCVYAMNKNEYPMNTHRSDESFHVYNDLLEYAMNHYEYPMNPYEYAVNHIIIITDEPLRKCNDQYEYPMHNYD